MNDDGEDRRVICVRVYYRRSGGPTAFADSFISASDFEAMRSRDQRRLFGIAAEDAFEKCVRRLDAEDRPLITLPPFTEV